MPKLSVRALSLPFDDVAQEGADDSLVRLPEEAVLESTPFPVVEWNISNTIPELAYLTHNYFRYYGKFPSVIPRKLLRDFGDRLGPRDFVLDNYMGSGTTLVEAKLAGVPSVGVDLNPLAVLAGIVKTTRYDVNTLRTEWQRIESAYRTGTRASRPGDSSLEKWFTEQVIRDLSQLKAAILSRPPSIQRSFFALAFLAIIRRVSRAYDGEVRPHINREKKSRHVIKAYTSKIIDMMERMDSFARAVPADAAVVAFCLDNKRISEVVDSSLGTCGLIITHPPYLNCFDYFPVFSLELMWVNGFEEVPFADSIREIRASEIRSWPATDDEVFKAYFDNNRKALQAAVSLLKPTGLCCVVIGDATIHKKLIPVHRDFSEMLSGLGLSPFKLIYRSTHYGIGKYAYSGRADYHGDAKKRDAILIFIKNY